MSYHIIHIDTPSVRLTCSNGQLTCRTDKGERSLPMEDIASVVVSSFAATISSEVLLQAAEHGVAFIYCRNFKPVSLVLPANRSTDTLLTRAVVALPEKQKKRPWQKTVDAKCANQYALAAHLYPCSKKLDTLRESISGHYPGKESSVARCYWSIFGEMAGNGDFVRTRTGGGANCLLNFGYAILLSLTLRNLFAVGLDPTFGIFHAVRERATPLAYDLMEPFRPCVDVRVFEWIRQHPHPKDWKVTPEFKKWIVPLTEQKITYQAKRLTMRSCLERVVRSFRSAVLEEKTATYQPWTLKNSRWDGCS